MAFSEPPKPKKPKQPKKSRKQKKADMSQSEATLRNKVDALFQLVTQQGVRIDELEKNVGIINTDYSFHTHDIVLRTGPKMFNEALANQWKRDQEAMKQASAQPPAKQPPKE